MTIDRQQDRFDSLISRHCRLIEAVCMRQAQHDSFLCAEYKQECYLTIWANLSTLEQGASLTHERNWIGKECRLAISRARSRQTPYVWVGLDQVAEVPGAGSDDEHAEMLNELATGLSPHESQIYQLIAGGAEHQEIADRMGIRKSSVAQAKYRIIHKIRKQFQITPKKPKKGER